MKIAVVSSSLNPKSRSRLLAKKLLSRLEDKAGVEVDFIDLQDHDLPMCDGGKSYGHPEVTALSQRLGEADAYVIATPIYNYTVNAALKNLTEYAGRRMENKLVGFVCAAGGAMSYMGLMQFANSLMLDFRTLILPRFVYTNDRDWDGDSVSEKIEERLEQFERDFLALARKLAD